MQFYTDRTRRYLPHALPDAEVFDETFRFCDDCGEYLGAPWAMGPNELSEPCICGSSNLRDEPGVWWWSCFPGCLPDSDPVGPFPNIFRAVRDARRY